jgi:branched-chain amino acid transport system substrate-binding protein
MRETRCYNDRHMRGGSARRIHVAVVGLIAATGIAASFAATANGSAAAAAARCGLGSATPATGSPIVLGAIVTDQPGPDFLDEATMARAYFACVNANGGIYGHPIRYDVLATRSNRAEVAAGARELVDKDHVVAIVGSASLPDCSVNGGTYAANGFAVLDVGAAPQCYGSPWSAPVNMGPRFSADAAAQAAIARGAKRLVVLQATGPMSGYDAGGIRAIARAHHIRFVALNAATLGLNGEEQAQRIVGAAGRHGAAVLIFPAAVADEILQGAQTLELAGRVSWACAAACDSDSLAASLGTAWNGKLLVAADVNDVHDDSGPDMRLYLSIRRLYAPYVPGGADPLGQYGFTIGQLTVRALLSIRGGTYTRQTVNAAIRALVGFRTDMLCRPWQFGSAPFHLSNSTGYTVWPHDGTMQIVPHSGCSALSSADPLVARVRGRS